MSECPVGKVERCSWRGVLFDADLLSLLEAMDSGSHDARSSGETAGHPDASFILGETSTLCSETVLAGSVDDPDESLAVLL